MARSGAIAEHIEVRQVNANGMWTGSSACDPKVAYVLEIVARNDLVAGLLDPEPDPPALGVTRDCQEWHGCGVSDSRELEWLWLLYPPCVACASSGVAVAQRIAV